MCDGAVIIVHRYASRYSCITVGSLLVARQGKTEANVMVTNPDYVKAIELKLTAGYPLGEALAHQPSAERSSLS